MTEMRRSVTEMSDLIRREDAMRVAMWFGRSEEQYPTSFIKKRIMEIPTADRPRGWIPCSERMPANDDWVIISVLDEAGDTLYRYSDFGWYFEMAKCWIVESEPRTDAVAWMPLPKPWKGADDDTD